MNEPAPSSSGEASLVSVVVPVLEGRFLAEAVASVKRQTWPHLEVIVVDSSRDGSTAHVFEDASIRRVVQAPRGIGAARNAGVAHASGALLAFLDADDLWTHDKLAVQTTALERDRALAGVFGHVREERMGRPGGRTLPGISAGTLLVRRDAFLQVGPFPEDVRVGEFMDWYARAGERRLAFAMLEDVVMLRRIHGSNTGIVSRNARSDYLRVLKNALDRRRAS